MAPTGFYTSGTLQTGGNASIGGALAVAGATTTNGITNTGNIATNTLSTTGNAIVGGNLAVTGQTSTGTLITAGAASVGTNLTVAGTTDVRGAIFNGGTANGGAVYVNDALTVNGPVNVGSVVISNTTGKISGLTNATLSSTSTEAVTGQQLFATNTALTALSGAVTTLDNREAAHFTLLSRENKKAFQGVAMGFAMNAAPLNLANGEGGISGGVGVFQNEVAGAIRAQYVTESGFGIGANFGFSADAVGGGVGASIKF
jgi:hypothetical protein